MQTPSFIDTIIGAFDSALRTVIKPTQRTGTRPNPAATLPESSLSITQQRHIASLMRVNHAGEISAQALYQGQAMTAHNPILQKHLHSAAAEEVDHLAWCEQRLEELESHTSVLAPLWYSGSFIIGALAGLAGDKISLGFLAETERQVTRHLQSHLKEIPIQDHKTHAILNQMILDEAKHAQSAMAQGGASLSYLIHTLMHWSSKVLTKSSYYL